MNKSEIFKKAHQLAKVAHVQGESYQVTFSAALKVVYQENKTTGQNRYEHLIAELNQLAIDAATAEDRKAVRAIGKLRAKNISAHKEIFGTTNVNSSHVADHKEWWAADEALGIAMQNRKNELTQGA